ncbi:hypothetical protein [Deinococcus sp.]|uniref:hypothetical protein n=1 Tax=Deinococcus sp. TaxID=47478 RepID=UPI003C7D7820
MDSADHTGAKKAASEADAGAAADTSAQAVRYIITRPCLAEGSLRLLKYLQPLFPAEGQVALQDGKGERFWATVDPVQGRLTGLGELYRAHNMGVNDVLLISPATSPGGAGHYLVECVVKPYARPPTVAPERPAPAPLVTEKRVVIHATPHVREVRMERVTAPEQGRPWPGAAAEARPGETGSRPADTDRQNESRSEDQTRTTPSPAPAVGVRTSTVQTSSVTPGSVRPSGTVRADTVGAKNTVQIQLSPGQPFFGGAAGRNPSPQPNQIQSNQIQPNQPQSRRPAAPITWVTARMQQRPAPPIRLVPALNTPIQMDFPAPAGAAVRGAPVQARSLEAAERPPTVQDRTAPTPSEETGGTPARPSPSVQPSASRKADSGRATEARQGGRPPQQDAGAMAAVRPPLAIPATSEESSESAHRPQAPEGPTPQSQTPAAQTPAAQTPGIRNPEDQLATLARLTGYACEHLGGGVVRLRAELGTHSYSVLIATTPQALTTHAWNESCDYMALLTPEDQRPQGIPRFTYAALEALLDNARLAPLTPIDLRGYWNTGSFDQESASSVGELVSAHLGQRGSFSHVLLTLAQQPAHSLVSLPRLAERLGNGVNTAELQSILETLSRPPFMALSPLPGGQYYLRSDVRDLLDEFGAYAEGLRRRLRPAPLAASGR